MDKTHAEAILKSAVIEGVKDAAQSPNNDLKQSDTSSVAKEVLKQVEPTIQHITSTEKWYQSRTMVGQIVGGISLVGGPLIGLTVSAEDQATITGAIIVLGQAFNFGMTLWSRYKAKKPLFSGS